MADISDQWFVVRYHDKSGSGIWYYHCGSQSSVAPRLYQFVDAKRVANSLKKGYWYNNVEIIPVTIAPGEPVGENA